MHKRCIICFRTIPSHSISLKQYKNGKKSPIQKEGNELKHFLRLLERYLQESGGGAENGKHLQFPFPEQVLAIVVGSCEECTEVFQSFSKLYREMKEIQLRLDWKLRKLTDLMQNAKREPSKVDEFRTSIKTLWKMEKGSWSCGEDYLARSILEYKNEVFNKCIKKLENGFPKLILPKYRPQPGFNSEPGDDFVKDLSLEKGAVQELRSTKKRKRKSAALIQCSSILSSEQEDEDVFSSGLPLPVEKIKMETCEEPEQVHSTSDSIPQSAIANSTATFSDQPEETTLDGGSSSDVGSSSSSDESESDYYNDNDDTDDWECDGRGSKKPKNKKSVPPISKRHTPRPDKINPATEDKFKQLMGIINITCAIPNCPAKPFSIPSAYEAHQKLHGEFTCHICAKPFDYGQKLALHEITDHSATKRDKELHKCPRPNCTSKLRERTFLVQHLLKHHLQLIPERMSHPCPICMLNISSTAHSDLERRCREHYHAHHNLDLDDSATATVHRCDQLDCPAYFRTQLQLDVHRVTAHGIRKARFKCPDCDWSFNFRTKLRTHQKRVHLSKLNLPHPCTFEGCEKRFETERDLRLHKNFAHLGKCAKLFGCPKCGKQVKGKRGLISHMESHNINKTSRAKPPKIPWICETCGRGFKNNAMLKAHHLSSHSPESWTFQCSLCPKKCMDQQRLDVHMRMHTQEKPFVCDLCGLKYAHSFSLAVHMKRKHGIKRTRENSKKSK